MDDDVEYWKQRALAAEQALDAHRSAVRAHRSAHNDASHTHQCKECNVCYTPMSTNEDCPVCGHDGK